MSAIELRVPAPTATTPKRILRLKICALVCVLCFARVFLCVFDRPAQQLQPLKPSIDTLPLTSLRRGGQGASVFYPYLLLLLPVSCLFAQARQKLGSDKVP